MIMITGQIQLLLPMLVDRLDKTIQLAPIRANIRVLMLGMRRSGVHLPGSTWERIFRAAMQEERTFEKGYDACINHHRHHANPIMCCIGGRCQLARESEPSPLSQSIFQLRHFPMRRPSK